MNGIEHFLAQRRGDVVLLALLNHVSQREVDFGFDLVLNLPQRPFAVVVFPGLANSLTAQPFVEGVTRWKSGG